MAGHSKDSGHAASAPCPFLNCGMFFNSYLALKMHKKRATHAGEGGTPVCRGCSASFTTGVEYRAHVRWHRSQRQLGPSRGGPQGQGTL